MHSKKALTISIVVDNTDSWIIPYAIKFEQILGKNHKVKFCTGHEEIPEGDIAFYLGCIKIAPKAILDRNKHNLVVHESELPMGKGFSPLTWQILEGKDRIPIVLFEAVEELDAGPVYLKDDLVFKGHELIDEMRDQQGSKTVDLCIKFVNLYPDIIHKSKPQEGQESFYERRTPEDSRLDTDKTIAEQFNLLRVVDNSRYPPYFELNGYKYYLKIAKNIKEKPAKSISIENHLIGQGHPPYIIAEMSGNHNQSLDRALKIVESAAASGVHALKLQTYTADTMTIDYEKGAFFIDNNNSLWHGQSLYKLYQQAYTPWEWHEPIFKKCRELGLTVFSTPFDETAVDFLEKLDVPAYKIASFENNHLPLIRKAASTGKPLIISTGMATIAELDEAVKTARASGCNDIILLKCISTYPASAEDINLMTIPHIKKLFETEAGLSDHTLGVGTSIAAIAVGATVIEKHFTLSRADGGVDSAFSMEPKEMKTLVEESYKAWQALGKVSYGVTDKEINSTIFRRSIYAVEDIQKGETFTNENIRIIRPGNGLPPKCFNIIIGKKASSDIKRGTPMSMEYINE